MKLHNLTSSSSTHSCLCLSQHSICSLNKPQRDQIVFKAIMSVILTDTLFLKTTTPLKPWKIKALMTNLPGVPRDVVESPSFEVF